MTRQAETRANPHASALALRNRSAAIYVSGRLSRLDGSPVLPLQELAHDALRGLVLSRRFSCVGGKSAFRRGRYRFAMYGELGDDASAAGLAHDLYAFTGGMREWSDGLATFVACFSGPAALDEGVFEDRLWRQLQLLHDLDRDGWDPNVSADPEDPSFSFSFAGQSF
ncbi:MAG: YqcI/YcgG family protein [Candidatus Limnocylindria bacterium]